jgi:hypothetical protein
MGGESFGGNVEVLEWIVVHHRWLVPPEVKGS